MLLATTAVGWERDIDLDLVTGTLPPRRPRESRAHNHRLQFCERIVHRRIPNEGSRGMDPAFAATTINQGPAQIFPETSFCMRVAISISRRQARSTNDIRRSMSWSLGSGISSLRSPSAAFG